MRNGDLMKKRFVSIHVHSCFASFSSNDELLYKELEGSLKDWLMSAGIVSSGLKQSREVGGDSLIEIYYFEDETFYNRTLKARDFHRHFDKTDEFKDLVSKYKKLGFNKQCPEEINAYYKRKELERERERYEAGYIFWTTKSPEDKDKTIYRGGLSDMVFLHPRLQAYLNSGGVFGYIGHSIRKKGLDECLEKEFFKLKPKIPCDQLDLFVRWLTSTHARHFADALEGCSFEEQKEKIKKNVRSIFKSAYICSLPEHEGNMTSTNTIEASLVFDEEGDIIDDPGLEARNIERRGW